MPGQSPSPDDAAVARLVARLSTEYVLRSIQMAARQYGGDIIMTTVAQSITAANVAHLVGAPNRDPRYIGLDDLPPDEERRPVSVLAIAGACGLPFETTRRYVNRLIAAGVVRRIKGGVITLTSAVASPENTAAIVENISNTRRFMRDLRRAGLTE
jgi:predicted transcriptional regulator